VRGRAHQGRQGRRVSCSQVDGMQASVVGVCLQNAESLATSRQTAWCLHNMPQWPSTAQIAVRAQQRAEAAFDTAPRHEDRVSGRRWCWSSTARAILRESRTLEPQLCIDLQPRCCVQLGCVVNRALPLDTRR
jgi:hypothetical protein